MRMRNTPLKAFAKTSPMRKEFDFSKKADYSPEATKGTIGAKIAKAVSPKNMLDMIPVGKAVKGAKAAWNLLRG